MCRWIWCVSQCVPDVLRSCLATCFVPGIRVRPTWMNLRWRASRTWRHELLQNVGASWPRLRVDISVESCRACNSVKRLIQPTLNVEPYQEPWRCGRLIWTAWPRGVDGPVYRTAQSQSWRRNFAVIRSPSSRAGVVPRIGLRPSGSHVSSSLFFTKGSFH